MIGSAAAPSTPIAVNCGAGQQALIRSSLVAGQAVSQVDCVPVGAGVAMSHAVAPRAVAAVPVAAAEAPLVATLDAGHLGGAPADALQVLTIGAVDSNGEIAGFSSD